MTATPAHLLSRYRALVKRDPTFAGSDPRALAAKAAAALQDVDTSTLHGPLDDGQALFLQVAASDAVQRMKRATARRLLECLSGNGRLLMPRLQATVDALLVGRNSATQTATALSHLLASFPDDQHMVPTRIGTLGPRPTVSITGPTDAPFAFEHRTTDARTWRVQIGRISVFVILPRQISGGRRAPAIAQIAEALSAVPSWALAHVSRVVVEPNRDRDKHDALMARDAGNVLRIYPQSDPQTKQSDRVSQEEFTLRLAHEVGHAVAATAWGDADRRGSSWRPWRKAMSKDGIAPSGYGRQRAAEDFAEMFSLFVLARGADRAELSRLFPARFALLSQLRASARSTRDWVPRSD